MEPQSQAKRYSSPYLSKEFLAFWIAGVLNNATYVVMNAGAKQISPQAVGYVYVCNVLPSFLTQLSGPYWYHYIPYASRMKIVACCMSISFLLVAFGQIYDILYLQFIGIAITSFQSGFGEASFLSFSAFFSDSRLVLTGWSSGTGMAGIVGYAWVSILMYQFQLEFYWVLLLGQIFPVLYVLDVLCVLPWPEISREKKKMSLVGKSEIDTYHNLEQTAGDDDSSAYLIQNDEDGVEDNGGLPTDRSHAAVTMTGKERLNAAFGLWKYMIPLFLVYFAEYITQSGTWAAIGFPVNSKEARNKFYEYANFTYQIGVFVSRSSGLVCKANLKVMWVLPFVQVALMSFFISDAYAQYWYNWSLLAPAFCVGLIGGAVYIGVFALIAEEVKPQLKEFSMGVAIIANTIGILASNVCGLYVQKFLYKYHNLHD